MHLWPSTRLRDSFKKDYLNKLQFNFRRKQQEDGTSSAKLLNGDDDNVGQVNKDDGVCCIFCKDFLLIFSLCFCCEVSQTGISDGEKNLNRMTKESPNDRLTLLLWSKLRDLLVLDLKQNESCSSASVGYKNENESRSCY